jgi:TolB-like protein/DNA-binding winged helix-turn-helix (wHTH) protein/lipopolysaccharide biosynthesis regulator YciM
VTRQPRQVYEFGPFRLIPKERLLLRDGQPIPLTAKCFDLLLVLVENSGHLVEKEELMQRIWPDCFVEEANLSVNMSALRRAMGESADARYIQTVPRHGYRFVEPVEERWDDGSGRRASAEPAVEETGSDAPPPAAAAPQPRGSRRALALRGAVLAVFTLAVTGALLLRRPAARQPGIQALAVLPLENLSGEPSQDYFADGLTTALATELGKIRALRIVAGPSTPEDRRSPRPLPEVGRDLNVDAVLTGAVKRSGDRVKITVQLVDVATDRSLWSDTYERDLRDVVALQRAMTRDVAGQIRIKLSPQEQVRFGSAGPVNPEAYDQYLRGQYYLQRQNREENEAAIQALEGAVETDATFAPAHAELAQAYVWKLFLFEPKEKKWAEKAFVAAEKALALDPQCAVAHLARGRLLWTPANRFPHEKAIREYRRAVELNPNLDEARNQLALVYCHIGAFEEAFTQAQRAVATNPNNNMAQFRTGQTLNFQGKHEEALSVLRAIPEDANPALVGCQISWALFNLGRREEASATLAKLLRDHPEDTGGLYTSVQAVMAASAGQRRLAEEKIRSAITRGKGFGHFHHTAYHIGCAYSLMGDSRQAVTWLEAAADDGFPCYPLFARDANLKGLRDDVRFAALLAKLKRQWEHYQTML